MVEGLDFEWGRGGGREGGGVEVRDFGKRAWGLGEEDGKSLTCRKRWVEWSLEERTGRDRRGGTKRVAERMCEEEAVKRELGAGRGGGEDRGWDGEDRVGGTERSGSGGRPRVGRRGPRRWY